MQNHWDTPILEVIPALLWGMRMHKGPRDILYVRPGDPSWRKNIVEERNVHMKNNIVEEPNANMKNKNAAFLNLMARHANGPEANAVVEGEIARHKKSNGGARTRKNRKN